MIRRLIIAAAMVAAAVSPIARADVAAHEGHSHNYRGQVAAIHDQDFVITTTDGKTVVFLVDAKTIYRRGKAKVENTALKVGERIVVSALQAPAGKSMTAQTVQLAPAATK